MPQPRPLNDDGLLVSRIRGAAGCFSGNVPDYHVLFLARVWGYATDIEVCRIGSPQTHKRTPPIELARPLGRVAGGRQKLNRMRLRQLYYS